MGLSLEQALARVPMWAGATDIRTTPLGGGITNRNYRVDVKGESFVLRITGEKTELLGIDRKNEYAANKAAARLGIAPEVVYFIEPEGYLVTRFITGRPLPPDEIGKQDNLQRVASALRKVHNLPAIAGTFSPFRTVENYLKIARQFNVPLPDNLKLALMRMYEIEAALKKDPPAPRLCHNDLLNENFLDDGNMRILDWEYAGMGDPTFDLANFAVHHGLSPEQELYLLDSYHATLRPLARRELARWYARHKLMKIVSDCREAMWGAVQIGISTLEFDFRGYADKHFQRMESNARDARYSVWLAQVAGEM